MNPQKVRDVIDFEKKINLNLYQISSRGTLWKLGYLPFSAKNSRHSLTFPVLIELLDFQNYFKQVENDEKQFYYDLFRSLVLNFVTQVVITIAGLAIFIFALLILEPSLLSQIVEKLFTIKLDLVTPNFFYWIGRVILGGLILAVMISFFVYYSRALKFYLDRPLLEPELNRKLIIILILLCHEQGVDNLRNRQKIFRLLGQSAERLLKVSEIYQTKHNLNNRWSYSLFRQMSEYLYERQRWLIAPQIGTLEVLQKDIEAFAHITIARNYGLFEWNGEVIETNDSNR